MKVTVNFGTVRVIVPCGNGEISVKELMNLAIIRYKKASRKPLDSWVTIHSLSLSSDGGILDPEDCLNEVADDREQIIAIYEEQGSPFLPHNGGDGTSASSMGTESPDIFRCKENPHHKLKEFYSENDVVITACDISSGLTPLYVRRESEPALNRLLSDVSNVDSTKRWSAAVTMGTEACGILKPLKMQDGRKEPLSELGTSTDQSRDRCIDSLHGSEDRQDSIILKSESGPLGIHVISDYDLHGRGMGIVVQGIEPGGRIDQDGRLCVGDHIVAINGKSLLHISFQKAQELFKDALKEPEIRIQLSKSSVQRNIETPLLPFYPNSVVCREFSRNEDETTDLVERQKQESLKTKVSSVKTTEKIPPSVRLNQKITPLTSNTRKIGRKIPIQLMKGPFSFGFSITTRDNPAGGNCPIYVKNILPKGAAVQDGRLKPGDRILEVNGIEMTGLSQTEAVGILRNIPQGGYVNLLVSRQELVPAVNQIRSQDMVSKKLYKPPYQAGDGFGIDRLKHREILTFCIPLNDTGLGICVKGKTSITANGPVDSGIFVKDIICGGAASKDGRLLTNDQLVKINDISLLRMTNTEAMEILHQVDNSVVTPNVIMLTIARQMSYFDETVGPLPSLTGQSNSVFNSYRSFLKKTTSPLENRSSIPDNSAKENSGSTVVFIPSTSVNKYDHVERGNKSIKEATLTNQLSVDVESQFSLTRDGIGRQSMSEKRFARLDARYTDTYQCNKRVHDEPKKHKLLQTEEQQMSEQQGELGGDRSQENCPSLGLKKSSSLENFPNVVQKLQMENQDQTPCSTRSRGKVTRGRSCNASFRAAVDHSYEGPVSETLETLNEETENSSETPGIRGKDVNISNYRHASSVNNGLATKETKNEDYKIGKTRTKKRLLQGLGSVFKFGKNKKLTQDQVGKSCQEEAKEEHSHIWQDTQEKQKRVQEQYRKSAERQRKEQWEQTYSKESFSPATHLLPRTRQKNTHQQWSGHYHRNEQEEVCVRERTKVLHLQPITRQKNDGMHNFEINKEIERPGNRLGFSHPSKYSHYVNYKEIQQHLQEFRQNKLQNHPHQKQRGKSSIEQKVRPVSNYFGYGSKQVLHQQSSNQQSNESDTKSLPHHSKVSTRPPTYQHN